MKDSLLESLRKDILTMEAYTPSSPDFPIKLDAMESPYTIPGNLSKEWNAMLAGYQANRYPDAAPTALIQGLEKHFGVPSDCTVLLGNGSDEIIQMVMLALGGQQQCVVAPEPCFSMYALIARMTYLRYVGVPLEKGFELNMTGILEAIRDESPVLICLASPNNPTGNAYDFKKLETVVQNAPGYTLLDEAYAPFTAAKGMELLQHCKRLLVLRTFSKIGFAGLRCGFLIGHRDILHQINKVRLPYNTGSFVQASVAFVIKHYSAICAQVEHVCKERDELFSGLSNISGVETYPTQANFILFRVQAGSANAVFNALKERGILIKNMSHTPGLDHCLRVSIGAQEDNETFLEELKHILAQS